MNTTEPCPYCPSPKHHTPLREWLRVKWQNWRVRKVGRAWCTIEKAIAEDPEYSQTIHANIAMVLYDATREGPLTKHPATDCRNMTIEQANSIADRIMVRLFPSKKSSSVGRFVRRWRNPVPCR